MNTFQRQYNQNKVKETFDHFIFTIIKPSSRKDHGFISFEEIFNKAFQCGISQAVAKEIFKKAEQKGIVKIFKDDLGRKHVEFLDKEL